MIVGAGIERAASYRSLLFQDGSGFWPVEEGRTTAVWFVEVGDETLAIATDSRESSFAEWAVTVEEVLATIEWR